MSSHLGRVCTSLTTRPCPQFLYTLEASGAGNAPWTQGQILMTLGRCRGELGPGPQCQWSLGQRPRSCPAGQRQLCRGGNRGSRGRSLSCSRDGSCSRWTAGRSPARLMLVSRDRTGCGAQGGPAEVGAHSRASCLGQRRPGLRRPQNSACRPHVSCGPGAPRSSQRLGWASSLPFMGPAETASPGRPV